MPWVAGGPSLPQSSSTGRAWWHSGPRGRRRDGNCPRWRSSGPPPWRSMTARYRSGSVPVPTSAGASEAEKCWQLQGADVVAAGPLGAGRDVPGVAAPTQCKNKMGKVRVHSSGRRFSSSFPRQMEANEPAITRPSQLSVLCAGRTPARDGQQRLRRGRTKDAYKSITVQMIMATVIPLHSLCFPPKRWLTEHCVPYQGLSRQVHDDFELIYVWAAVPTLPKTPQAMDESWQLISSTGRFSVTKAENG